MKDNLRTVFLDKDNHFVIFNGWTVSVSAGSVHAQLLGSIPIEKADVSIHKENPCILHSAAIFKKEILRETLFPVEENIYNFQKTFLSTAHELVPEADNKFYYLFLLDEEDNISFSSTFDVLVDGLAEDPYHSEKYTRIVYVSLPYDAPLILDSKNTICVSPF